MVFPTIFEDQLDGWWRDRTTWPTLRSFGTFTRSFDCQFHSTLLDLTDEPLIEEHVSVDSADGRRSVDRISGHFYEAVDGRR